MPGAINRAQWNINFVKWANEFEKEHQNWYFEEEDYLEIIHEFAKEKIIQFARQEQEIMNGYAEQIREFLRERNRTQESAKQEK